MSATTIVLAVVGIALGVILMVALVAALVITLGAANFPDDLNDDH